MRPTGKGAAGGTMGGGGDKGFGFRGYSRVCG